MTDVRIGMRQLVRSPGATVLMVLVLALGIGVNTALFTVHHSQVTAPPPGVKRVPSLVRVRTIGGHGAMSYRQVLDHAGQTEVFAGLAAWTVAGMNVALDAGREETGPVAGRATYVTPNYFEVLGVEIVLGNTLARVQDTDALTAVISHELWQEQYGGARDVIGRTLAVNDAVVTIVGVAPARFEGAEPPFFGARGVWLPVHARGVIEGAGQGWLSSYDSTAFRVAAHLRPGVTLAQASAAADLIAKQAEAQQTYRRSSPRGASQHAADVVVLLRDNYEESDYAARRRVMEAAAGGAITLLVLLITCTNVSALLAAQAMRRRREIAVRLSLGAGRARIVRQLVTESVIVSLAAGALGTGILFAALEPAGRFLPDTQLSIAWPTILFTSALAIGTGILFGLSPALHGTRVSVSDVLKDSAAGLTHSRLGLQRALVIAQVALTQPLLVGVGAVLLSVVVNARSQLGSPLEDRIATLQLTTPPVVRRVERGQVVPRDPDYATQVAAALSAVPGVAGAVPAAGYGIWSPTPQEVYPADRAHDEGPESFRVATEVAAPGYFVVMGIPLTYGREFDAQDSATVIIGSDLAGQLWGSANPIGRRIQDAGGGNVRVVVGVFDTRAGGGTETSRGYRVFTPLSQAGPGAFRVLIRTTAPVLALASRIREATAAAVPAVTVTGFTTLAQERAAERREALTAASIAGAAGLLALLLAAIGLSALIAFAVRQRTREIGIRTSLGAAPARVIGMFFTAGVRLAVIGLLCGLPLSLIALRLVQNLEGDQPLPTPILATIVATAVITVAAVAAWIPARRAALVDPLTALRGDGS